MYPDEHTERLEEGKGKVWLIKDLMRGTLTGEPMSRQEALTYLGSLQEEDKDALLSEYMAKVEEASSSKGLDPPVEKEDS